MTELTDTDSASQTGGAPAPAAETIEQRVAAQQQAWKDEAQTVSKLATIFGPLAKASAHEDIAKLPALLERVESNLRALPCGERGMALLAEVAEALRARKQHMQQYLAKDLAAACKDRKLSMTVVRREEPVEVRIPPFSVVIDREKGKAAVRFARLTLDECAADAGAIMDAHDRAFVAMRSGFDSARFFEAALHAWQAARGAGHGTGDRVEILDFLPFLALQLQSPAFRIEPNAQNYRGYSRARFAFDVLQLRNAGGLRHDGWRMNLGVATGTTASKKNRTIFIEDENGSGEFKLTVFFAREENR